MSNPKRRPAGFVIVLRAERSVDDDDAVRRLRSFLKAAYRSWGLRCISAEPEKSGDTTEQQTP